MDRELTESKTSGSGSTLPESGKPSKDDCSESSPKLESDAVTRKQAEERFLEEKHKLESLLSAIRDGITVQDRQFRVLYQNDAHKKLHGDCAGQYCYKAYQHRDQVCNGCLVAKSFEDGEIHNREVSTSTGRGIAYLEVTASPIKDAHGDITSCVEFVRDITAHKKLEEHIRHSQKMEAVGTLTGGIAHDFNNLLTAMLGYGDLLRNEIDPGGRAASYLQGILFAAEKASRLTRALLAFSRKQTFVPKPVALNTVVEEMQKLMSKLTGEEIELKVELSKEDLVVMADAGQLEQVLLNLAANARDAMPTGGRLAIGTKSFELGSEFITRHGYGEQGRYAVISVSDTGTGMDEQTRRRVFEPFFTTKDAGKGTGLGLAIAYGIIKQHRGYINVASEPGKGAAFNVYLPLMNPAPERMEPFTQSPRTGGTETILIAEDDAVVRGLLKILLEEYGYCVAEVADGEHAVKRFLELRNDVRLVILDVILPKMDSKSVYLELKRMSPGIRVLFTSGYPEEIIRTKGLLVEGEDFIAKPILPGDLLQKIRELLDA
ncbi:MAG TPA: ATP-binding protein [Dissulfurispiraceae bacterium]